MSFEQLPPLDINLHLISAQMLSKLTAGYILGETSLGSYDTFRSRVKRGHQSHVQGSPGALPGGPVVKTPGFHWGAHGFDSWSGSKIPKFHTRPNVHKWISKLRVPGSFLRWTHGENQSCRRCYPLTSILLVELRKLKGSGKDTKLGPHQSCFLAPLLCQSKLCTKTEVPTSGWVQWYSCVDGCGHCYTKCLLFCVWGIIANLLWETMIKHREVRYSLGCSKVSWVSQEAQW